MEFFQINLLHLLRIYEDYIEVMVKVKLHIYDLGARTNSAGILSGSQPISVRFTFIRWKHKSYAVLISLITTPSGISFISLVVSSSLLDRGALITSFCSSSVKLV
mmetsp:Transcript_1479/g.2003  ORF Transcript_1479/g.2003 Transcript_1479/m.2003 type:complete len:105 (-) Transcript_1479:804-1118(-)